MENNLLYGIVIGFGAFYLLDRYKNKKPCKCNQEKEISDNSEEKSSKNDCEKAVDLVMNEIRKTSRMSVAKFAVLKEKELQRCLSMSKE